MSTADWLGILGTIGSLVGVVKYLITYNAKLVTENEDLRKKNNDAAISDLNTVTKSHEAMIQSHSHELKTNSMAMVRLASRLDDATGETKRIAGVIANFQVKSEESARSYEIHAKKISDTLLLITGRK